MARKSVWTELGQDKLLSSGLTTDKGDELGMYEVASAATLDPKFEARPALVIPYYGSDKEPLSANPNWPQFYRVRYLGKRQMGFKETGGEKELRYEQPAKSGVCAYFPRDFDWKTTLASTGNDVVITEGELKAAAACDAGFPTIGLGGVWNFRRSHDGIWFLPELAKVDWKRRETFICFDSDYMTKPGVCHAINALCEELQERGAIVKVVMLPQADESHKIGLDDYLLEHTPDDFAKLLGQAQPLGMSSALWKTNEQVLYIRDPGLVVVERTKQKMSPDAFKSHSDWSTDSATDVTLSKEGTLLLNKAPAAPIWLRWPLRRSAHKLTYAPGDAAITLGGDFNQWPGWGTKPKRGAVGPWLELTKYLFANSEAGVLDYFYDWCAYPIQFPGTKMFTAVVIHGIHQGTGKTLVGYTLGEIYGQNYKEIKDEDLEETYWAENKQFILGDEVSGKDNRQYANTLKRLITQRHTDINIKYVPQYTLPNCMNFLFTSNHGDSFFLEDTDRRYLVVEVQDEPLTDEFYAAYDKWLWKEDGAAHLHHWLMERKISKAFNPAAPAMKTAARARMIAATKGDAGAWAAELMQYPDQVLRMGQMRYTRDLFTNHELLDIYRSTNPDGKLSAVGLGRVLAQHGCLQIDNGQPVRGVNGKLERHWAVRNQKVWAKVRDRKKIEKHITSPPVRDK